MTEIRQMTSWEVRVYGYDYDGEEWRPVEAKSRAAARAVVVRDLIEHGIARNWWHALMKISDVRRAK